METNEKVSASKYRKYASDAVYFKHGLYMYHDMSKTQTLQVILSVDILKEVNKKIWKQRRGKEPQVLYGHNIFDEEIFIAIFGAILQSDDSRYHW